MNEPTKAAFHVEQLEDERELEPQWIRKERENQRPERAVRPAASAAVFDLGAHLLDQGVILDAGRAGGDASHATQARVDVPNDSVVNRRSLADLLHQVNAASRRVHFLAPGLIGGARGQAEPAVHARVDQLPVRHQMPPTKRPGFNRCTGSKRSFILCITGNAAGTGPHSPTVDRTGRGAACSTSEPPRLCSCCRASESKRDVVARSRGSPATKPKPRDAYQRKVASCREV